MRGRLPHLVPACFKARASYTRRSFCRGLGLEVAWAKWALTSSIWQRLSAPCPSDADERLAGLASLRLGHGNDLGPMGVDRCQIDAAELCF